MSREVERVLNKIERVMSDRGLKMALLSDAEIDQRINQLLQKAGTTRESIVAQFGSMANYIADLKKKIKAEKLAGSKQ